MILQNIRYYLHWFFSQFSLFNLIWILCVSFLLFLLILFTVVGYWAIFEKAGQRGWKALIPFYNLYILSQISGKGGKLFVLWFIPGMNLIYYLFVCFGLAESFGKSKGFALGLWLLSGIFTLILGFGDAVCSTVSENEEDEEVYWTVL